MGDSIWDEGEQSTIPQLFARRMESNPDGEYLDVSGVKLRRVRLPNRPGGLGAPS